MYRGKVPFPYFGAAMRPEHNHTHGQPLPSKSEFLSFKNHLKFMSWCSIIMGP